MHFIVMLYTTKYVSYMLQTAEIDLSKALDLITTMKYQIKFNKLPFTVVQWPHKKRSKYGTLGII